MLGPLPRYTETLLGGHVQPVGLVVVADADRLRTALEREGWRAADVVTPKDLAPSWWSGIRGETKADDPVAPSFYDTRAPDLVLRRPAGGDGEYEYETQLWELPLTTAGGCTVWAGTASIHDRTQWDWSRLYPARLGGRQIDDERDALTRALAADGRFDDLGRLRSQRPGRARARPGRTSPTAGSRCSANPVAQGRRYRGGGRNRTFVSGLAGRRLNHSATPPKH